MKKEIVEKEEYLKSAILELAKQKNTSILFGTHKKCSIKEYTKVIYPEDKKALIELIKNKGLYDSLSSINYMKLNSKIIKNDIDNEILNLIKKEKAFRLSLIDLG